MAVLSAVKGLLIFHKQEPEKTYDVIRLADSAVSHVKGFQECMPLIQALRRCGTLEWEVPENSETLRRERAEALLLAEQIVEFIASRLPEHD
jgi:HEPN domain-containing protein